MDIRKTLQRKNWYNEEDREYPAQVKMSRERSLQGTIRRDLRRAGRRRRQYMAKGNELILIDYAPLSSHDGTKAEIHCNKHEHCPESLLNNLIITKTTVCNRLSWALRNGCQCHKISRLSSSDQRYEAFSIASLVHICQGDPSLPHLHPESKDLAHLRSTHASLKRVQTIRVLKQDLMKKST